MLKQLWSKVFKTEAGTKKQPPVTREQKAKAFQEVLGILTQTPDGVAEADLDTIVRRRILAERRVSRAQRQHLQKDRAPSVAQLGRESFQQELERGQRDNQPRNWNDSIRENDWIEAITSSAGMSFEEGDRGRVVKVLGDQCWVLFEGRHHAVAAAESYFKILPESLSTDGKRKRDDFFTLPSKSAATNRLVRK